VIDRRARPSGWSKANLVNPRTIEVLAGLGVGEALLAEGVPIRRTRILRAGRVIAAFATPPFPQTAYPYALQLPQARLEAILEARLAALGGTVERGVSLRDFRQDRDGVVAIVAGSAGCEEVRAAFLAGCDGAHSAVRERLGVGFAGEAYPESFVVADVHADWQQPGATNLMWLHRDGVMLAWACREPGLWHFFFNLTADQDARIASPSLDDVGRIVAERTGDGRVRLDRPEWISKFQVQRRRVGQFRVGRVFLAGDAAHILSPMVGKGLGIGVQDGATLGALLARVLRDGEDYSLLDAYRREREPVTTDVFRESHATHRLMIPRGAAMRRLRDGLIYVLRARAAQRWLLARNFQV
jgi:4,5-epoxidase